MRSEGKPAQLAHAGRRSGILLNQLRSANARTKPVLWNCDPIRMFYSDYEPAHFHAIYREYEALVEVETLLVFRGSLPRRALAMVLEWATLHRVELRDDWRRARNGETLNGIEPLD